MRFLALALVLIHNGYNGRLRDFYATESQGRRAGGQPVRRCAMNFIHRQRPRRRLSMNFAAELKGGAFNLGVNFKAPNALREA